MSKVIQIRHRIKAIETIHKITHAMRLISMSSHARLKGKRDVLDVYLGHLERLYGVVSSSAPSWHNPLLDPAGHGVAKNTLCIIVGPQRGLCGNFNNALHAMYMKHRDTLLQERADVIVVGKRALEQISFEKKTPIIASYTDLNQTSLFTIAQQIAHILIAGNKRYTRVFFLSTHFKSFFLQQPEFIQIIPLHMSAGAQESADAVHEYLWDAYKPEDILDELVVQYVETTIQKLILESLLAEQAARFISMDSATRNAEKLRDSAKLQYNKLRQANITKEVTELSGSFF